jgi:trans-2,3-dihydro-3-hydroxyanthranilate isomerase
MAATDLTYHVVDVFTDVPFAGNPLAVVLGADRLTARQMQTLAREFQLSETAFPLLEDPEAAVAGADYRLRIFTPEVELPFAGHPSVGTAWLVQELGLVPAHDGRVVQLCGAGALPLGRDDAGRVELRGGDAHLGTPVAPAVVAAACGLAAHDVSGPAPRVAGAGIDFVVAPVRTEALSRAQPDLSQLRRSFPADVSHSDDPNALSVAGVLLVAWGDDAASFRVRMFAADVGVAEDAATGSAALALGVYLLDAGRLAADGESGYVVHQGVEMGRPSVLRCRLSADAGRTVGVWVAGDVVAIASGTVHVPPHSLMSMAD